MKKMGFYTDVVSQIFKGKTRTYRLRDHKLKRGDRIVFENTQSGEVFGHAVITDVKRVKVKDIDLKDALHYKTYKTREGLIKALRFHYPDRTVTLETHVFIYTYDFTPANS
jgi:hypothetical protein